MPSAPMMFCTGSPGCANQVRRGRCAECQKGRRQRQQHSHSRTGVNYGRRWKAARARFLGQQPLCVDCEAEGRMTLATEVDHQVRHRGDYTLFWDESNWRPRCKPHHSAKTAREVGLGGYRNV